MHKFYLTLVLLLSLGTAVTAQTTLNAGDIGFTLINMDGNNDEFAFVLLTDVTPGTSIVFTDDEYLNGGLDTQFPEGRLLVTFNNAFSCGTEVFVIDVATSTSANQYEARVNGSTAGLSASEPSGNGFSLATAGETIIAFQDPNPATSNPARFLAALANTGVGFGAGLATGSGDLPPGLTVGASAVALNPDGNGNEFDNYRYNCTVRSGTPAQLASGMFTAGNWSGDNTTLQSFPNCGFTCQSACTDPVLTSLSTSNTSPCVGDVVTITINGNFNTAGNWNVRQGLCNGTIVQSPTSNSFNVTIGTNNTYSVTAQNCNGSEVCQTITITPRVPQADAGADQLLVTYPTTLGGSSAGAGTGTWTEVSGDGAGSFSNPASSGSSFSGTAGVLYTLRWTVGGNGCPTSSDDVQVSSSNGNTTLAAGDVLFTLMNTDAPDEFAFVVTRDVTAGTTFSVTDQEFRGGALNGGEGIGEITFTGNTTCGSEFLLTSANSDGLYVAQTVSGTGAVTYSRISGDVLLSTARETMIALQGPTYLTALSNCGFGFGNADGACTDLPTGLTEGVNAFAYVNGGTGLAGEPNNIKYDCSVTSGSAADLGAALTTQGNWQENVNQPIAYGNGCGFSCSVCVDPVITAVTPSNASPCPGETITLTVSGMLNGAARWAVYSTACGTDEVATSTTNTITLTVPASQDFFVAGVDGCVNSPTCTTVNITTAANPADIADDVISAGGTSATVTPTSAPNAGQTATLGFIGTNDGLGNITDNGGNYTVTGTAGQAYTLELVYAGGTTCPTSRDTVQVIFLLNQDLDLGDIAFTGINTDALDAFSFVARLPISAGTTIDFTDRGWDGGFLNNGEATMRLTLTQPLACNDVVYLEQGQFSGNITDWTARLADGTGSVAGTLNDVGASPAFLLGSAGDQIFAYQGPEPTGEDPVTDNANSFLAAISTNCSGGFCNNDWDNQIASASADSDLPGIFNAGEFSILISPTGSTNEVDNGRFDCTTAGTTQPTLAHIYNPANWEVNDNQALDLSQTCITSCCTPGTIDAVSANVDNQCSGTAVTISFTGMLNDSDEWLVSTGMCDGTFQTTLLGMTGSSFTVSPAVTTTYYIRAEGLPGGCAATTCTEYTVTVDPGTITAVCRDTTIVLDGTGNATVTGAELTAGASNSCGTTLSYAVGPLTLDCTQESVAQTASVTVSSPGATDVTCTSTVTVIDDTAPTGSCQNLVLALNANGQVNATTGLFINELLTSFSDNCAAAPFPSVGGTSGSWDCSDLGNNQELYGFYDRDPANPEREEFICRPLIQIVDPLGACASPPTASCQDITVSPVAGGQYAINANDFNNGSSGNFGVRTLVFGNQTSTIGQLGADANNLSVNQGQSFIAPQTGLIRAIRVRFNAARSGVNVFFYNSATGSGTAGGVGTPIYTESNVELFTSSGGALTEIILSTPLPVVQGQPYSFIFEGQTDPYYSFSSSSYPDGDFIFDYDLASGCCTFGDLVFEVDFIGPNATTLTTQSTNTTFNLDIYAVDNQGTLSPTACTPTYTIFNAAPNAVCQDVIVEIDAGGMPTVNGQPFTATALDGGSTDTEGIDPNGFSVNIMPDCDDVANSPLTATLTVTDNFGATATCTSLVTVEDNIAPTGTCQNVVVALDANGQFNPNNFGTFFINNVLTSFNDNCAAGPDGVIGGFQFSFNCTDLGINNELYGFRDRPTNDPDRLEFVCRPLIQVVDPLGVCTSAPTVACQDLTVAPDPSGEYVVNANDFDNGSSGTFGPQTLVFGNQTSTISQLTSTTNFDNLGHGQSFVASQTGQIRAIRVRFNTAVSDVDVFFYNSATGSGLVGGAGSPVYTENDVELFASPEGALTEIVLTTPFPVVQGQSYSFVFDGFTDPFYNTGSDVYPDGDFIFGYDLASGCCAGSDLVFEVDFIGPSATTLTTQNPDTTFTLGDIFAVDAQGTVSPTACVSTLTIDRSLPVEWLGFGAVAGAKVVDLQWEVSYEPDNAGFTIERSPDGTAWADLTEVAAHPDANRQVYDHRDEAPLPGTSYYRLRQTDFDGTVTYSPIREVTFAGDDDVTIFPNPTSGKVTVLFPPTARIEGFFDVSGRLLDVPTTPGKGRLEGDLSNLPAGVYLVRAVLADGDRRVHRIIVR